MIAVNKKLTPVFIDPKDKRLKITLMSVEETKKRIEYWYIFVEIHQKANALYSIYMLANTILEEEKKVDIQKAVEKVKELNEKFTKLSLDFEPLILEHLSKDAYKRMQEKVETVTNNKYSLGFDDVDEVGMEAYIIAKDTKVNYIFETIYQEDVAKLLKLISLSDANRKAFTRIIYYNSKQSTVDYLKSVTPEKQQLFLLKH